MALIEIVCPHCERRGYVGANRLPGVLRCSDCGFATMVHDGERIVRSHSAAINTTDNRKPRRPPQKRVLTPRGKRVLTPRIPAVA